MKKNLENLEKVKRKIGRHPVMADLDMQQISKEDVVLVLISIDTDFLIVMRAPTRTSDFGAAMYTH